MTRNPQLLGLLEEILDSGKRPEEACRDCPELLAEVRARWQAFCRIDAQIRTLLPGLGAAPAYRHHRARIAQRRPASGSRL